jgi:hypothetical protein
MCFERPVKHERDTTMSTRSTTNLNRDAGIQAEAIIAAVLTLAVVGTGKQSTAKYVVGEYKKVLQEFRATGDSFN